MRNRICLALVILIGMNWSPALSQTRENELSGRFLSAVITTSEPHRESLEGLIKGKPGLPSWVRNMMSRPRFIALASETVEIAGKPMELFRACEAGRCAESALAVLYTPDGKRAVLRIADDRLGVTIFGDASEAELQVLSR
ncbi:hypothetical protein FE840_009205 [Peteryoungia desertarenae]|uniref:Inhibitor of lysozyme (Ivy) n=1 Tax=Peteryoungia desertarenae TaxID=1813451 RepID=A0ABX6QME7_9HYPH|nr:Ivy family c-type lysozyme inhibitor [Peteryoungia desertarenae]QLF69704.1 hypothetical protein FE840_009205 [Peteryoungia desertarenae]